MHQGNDVTVGPILRSIPRRTSPKDMAEVRLLIFIVIFVVSTNQGYGDEMGQMGVLHAEGSEGAKDFCIVYNPQWPKIPTELDQTPKYSLVEAQPPTLCGPAKNPKEMEGAAVSVQRGNCTLFSKGIHAQDAFASEVIIVSNETLFSPEGNSSAGEYKKLKIPLAVISKGDWQKLKTLGDVKVQLYAPPAANIDGNLAVMWVLAVCTVAIGAYWAGITNRKIVERRGLLHGNSSTQQGQDPANGDVSDEDGTIEVTPVMVLIFVILICGTLLLLYFFYDYLVYIVIALFCIAACNGLFECLRPIVLWLPLGNCKVPPNRIPLLKKEPQIRIILLILFCMSFAIWWGIERNKSYAWILQDILGISFCISLIKTIRLSSLKVCTILLVLLLIYDIFFVFITPLFSAGKSVMVEVATGGGNKEQLPMVLKVPRLTKSVLSVCQRPYSLLGFGDILVPGLYIGFCHSFDIITNTPHKIYYISTTIAYGVGLVITFVMLFVMQQGQPALLYLVPCTLITGFAIGWLRGDLKKLWTGRMLPDSLPPVINSDDNEDDVILSRSRTSKSNDQGGNETERLLNIANVD